MTTVVTSMRFACRRRTAADWTSGNEILLAGEIGVETDLLPNDVKAKIGDGVTAWNSLGYAVDTTASGSGSAAWGAITGTLTDQTDLVAALALKVPTSRTVNGQPLSGNVTLTASDVGAATAAQGATADSAVQPGDLATVATSGAYADLSGKPTLGTAAATAATDYATAAQGALADSAVQDIASTIHAETSKAAPVDADELGLVDSAASNVLKKLTWANLKATLKTHFDTLYGALASANVWTQIQTFGAGLKSSAGIAFSATATAPTQTASAQAGVAASLTASDAVAGSTNAGAEAGGPVNVTTGAAKRLTSGNANGGDFNVNLGAGIGTGRAGIMVVPRFGSVNQYWDFGGEPVYKFFGTDALTLSSGSFDLNAMNLRLVPSRTHEWLGAIGTVASAATVSTVMTSLIFMSGTAAIDTLTPATGISSGSSTAQIVHIIPTGAFTWTTAGNIAIAGTAVVGRLLTFVYSKATSKWYPSYI